MPAESLFESELSRRALLRVGVGIGVAGAGAVLLGAHALPARAVTRGAGVVALPYSSDLYASPDPQRFSLVLQRATGGGIKYVSGPPVEVRFKGPSTDWQPYTALRLDTEGLPAGRGVYRTEAVFDRAGNWKGQVKVNGDRANGFALALPEQAVAPVPGDAAPRAASPTLADPLGVDPICTREPPCPLHTVSLSEVIGSGTPVAVMFATPALCVSAYCGPVLDEMLDVMGPYQDRVRFVHVDIYKNLNTAKLSPTVKAWGLPSEPWLYGIDGAGTITARLDTAFAKTEMVELFDGLVGGSSAPAGLS
jgi:hypothetical protein